MAQYSLSEIKTRRDIRQWLDFPAKLYKGDKYYVRPLDKEVEQVFDRKQNKLFRHGDAARFLLKNEKGKIVGRIAVFMMKRHQPLMKKKKTDNVPEAVDFSTALTIKRLPTYSSIQQKMA